MAEFFVYILASRYRGTMYVGSTGNIHRRVAEHKSGLIEGFTKQYDVTRLVYFEPYSSIDDARQRERVLKKWRREWKFNLIETDNPGWNDLADQM